MIFINQTDRIMSQLEDHCTSPAFLEPINEFISRTSKKIIEIPAGKDHPPEYYQYFLQYTKLVDSLLDCTFEFFVSVPAPKKLAFLKEHKYTEKKVYECCLRLKQVDPEYLNCLDFILATSEYEHFYGLMREYSVSLFLKSGKKQKSKTIQNRESLKKTMPERKRKYSNLYCYNNNTYTFPQKQCLYLSKNIFII